MVHLHRTFFPYRFWSHAVGFSRTQCIAKLKIGSGRGKDGRVGEGLVEGCGGLAWSLCWPLPAQKCGVGGGERGRKGGGGEGGWGGGSLGAAHAPLAHACLHTYQLLPLVVVLPEFTGAPWDSAVGEAGASQAVVQGDDGQSRVQASDANANAREQTRGTSKKRRARVVEESEEDDDGDEGVGGTDEGNGVSVEAAAPGGTSRRRSLYRDASAPTKRSKEHALPIPAATDFVGDEETDGGESSEEEGGEEDGGGDRGGRWKLHIGVVRCILSRGVSIIRQYTTRFRVWFGEILQGGLVSR